VVALRADSSADGVAGRLEEWIDGDDWRRVLRELVPGERAGTGSMGRPTGGPKDYRFDEGSAALGIPFNFENDHVMVQGQVNGRKPIWFMLDTGAEATIINKPRMDELGLTPHSRNRFRLGGRSGRPSLRAGRTTRISRSQACARTRPRPRRAC